jgi:phosphoglycolate phosphatase-like HAD superfamily hydrolase
MDPLTKFHTIMIITSSVVAVLALVACSPTAATLQDADGTAASASDALPSWNEGAAKTTILEFVAAVTDPAGDSYVPPEERIAVFDNDGTLWTEKPIPAQAFFVNARIADMAPDHPEWQTTQPFQALLQHDMATLATMSKEQIMQLIAVTHAGMTVEEFDKLVKDWLETARHPRFNVPYTETVYQPMLELLDYLRANAFNIYIVSGGGVEFMRAFADPVYGIPPEKIIGSSLKYEFRMTENGPEIVRLAELASFNNEAEKPVNIQRVIGRRPILAVGNSDGDLAMFQYTSPSDGPSLALLVVHDDAEREYEYVDGAEEVRTAAVQSPWMYVSVKRDFATVFPADSGQ